MAFCDICEKTVGKTTKFKGHGYSLYVCKKCLEGKGEKIKRRAKRR